MQITDIRITLAGRPERGRLRAFCSVTFDDQLAIHDIRIIQGDRQLFMAMPSRPLRIRCPGCLARNDLSWKRDWCLRCGRLLPKQDPVLRCGRWQPFLDIVHPVNQKTRLWLQEQILAAYREEEYRESVLCPVPETAAENRAAAQSA